MEDIRKKELVRAITETLIKSEVDEYEKRIEKMLLNSFDYVIECIKIYKARGISDFNGFLGSDAIFYFDYKLNVVYKVYRNDTDWCKPCSDKWYKLVEKFCKW